MANNTLDFGLSEEVLSIIPTGPYEQLELAQKIMLMATEKLRERSVSHQPVDDNEGERCLQKHVATSRPQNATLSCLQKHVSTFRLQNATSVSCLLDNLIWSGSLASAVSIGSEAHNKRLAEGSAAEVAYLNLNPIRKIVEVEVGEVEDEDEEKRGIQ